MRADFHFIRRYNRIQLADAIDQLPNAAASRDQVERQQFVVGNVMSQSLTSMRCQDPRHPLYELERCNPIRFGRNLVTLVFETSQAMCGVGRAMAPVPGDLHSPSMLDEPGEFRAMLLDSLQNCPPQSLLADFAFQALQPS